MTTRAVNILRAVDLAAEAGAHKCGLIGLCHVTDAAANEIKAAVATEVLDGMLCARVGDGNAIWPLPHTFDAASRAKWDAEHVRAAAAALIDDQTAPVAVALRALAKVLMDEIQQIKAGKPKASKTWPEHCAALRAGISAGLGDA